MYDIEAITMTKKLAKVSFVYPPIPDRDHDYAAVLNNYDEGSPQGFGPDAGAALHDLMTQYLEGFKGLDTDAVDAIEAFMVNAQDQEIAKWRKSLGKHFTNKEEDFYKMGYAAALSSVLDVLS